MRNHTSKMHNHKGKLCTEDKSHMAKTCVSIEACTQITITSWPLCIIPRRSTKVSSKNNSMLLKTLRSQDILFYCSHRIRIRSPPFLLGWLAVKLRIHRLLSNDGITSVRLCPAFKVLEILTRSSWLHSKCSYPLVCFSNFSFDQQLFVFLLGVPTVIKFLTTKLIQFWYYLVS